MAKRTEVVYIDEGKQRMARTDEESHRIIFSIGGQRYAIDWLSCISQLPPSPVAGDRPGECIAPEGPMTALITEQLEEDHRKPSNSFGSPSSSISRSSTLS